MIKEFKVRVERTLDFSGHLKGFGITFDRWNVGPETHFNVQVGIWWLFNFYFRWKKA